MEIQINTAVVNLIYLFIPVGLFPNDAYYIVQDTVLMTNIILSVRPSMHFCDHDVYLDKQTFYQRPVLASGYCRCLRLCVYVCLSVCVCQSFPCPRNNSDPFKLGSPNLDQRCQRRWLRSLLFSGLIDPDLQGQIKLESSNLPHFEAVRAITHHPFKLGSPNSDQRCKIIWLRSLTFWGAIDLQCQIWLKSQIFRFYPTVIHSHHITTREPWVPRLFHGPDCFTVSFLCMCSYA